jgi:hypothetical protein
MAKDVALRDLDQAGFRISNLGTPTAAGDATKTDNTAVPKAAAGAGAPGTSLLAAPADHVHPAPPASTGGVVIALDDPSEQASGGGPSVIWEAVVNFGELPGDRMICSLGAVVRAVGGTGKVELKIGGDPGQSDGALAVAFETSAPGSELKGGRAEVAKPAGLQLVKLVASTPSDTVQVFARAKSILFRSV